MSQLSSKISLAICTALLLLSSCSKKYSSDNPLPSVYPPSVIIGSDNGILYGYDPVKGTKNWSTSFANSIYASPLVYHGYVYIGTVNYLAGIDACDTLFKVNSSTGVITKRMVVAGVSNFSIKATPIADDSVIFLATTNGGLYVIDTGTSNLKWSFTADGPLVASPTIYKGNVYFASTAGTVYALSEIDGTVIWSFNPAVATGSPVSFSSSPAICDPYLFIGSNTDSTLYCLRLVTTSGSSTPAPSEVLKWAFKTKGEINSSPAAAFGKVIVGSNDFNVYCVDTSTGGQDWKFPTASNINSSPVIYNSKVYIGSNDYNLYAINILNGSLVWKETTNGLVKSSPLAYNGMIYIGSYDKYFYAFDSETGTLKWTTNVNGQMQCSPAIEDYSLTQHNSQVSGYTNY